MMRAARLLDPRRYGRRLARESAQWPVLRRVAQNWRLWALRSALRPFVALPCRITSVGGARFYLGHDFVDDRILIHLFASNTSLYFPDFIQPPPGSLLLDIGAHHGLYAVEALRRYPGTRLIAVEPDPRACDLLERNLAANNWLERAQIIRAGIGQESGEAFLAYSPEGSWGSRTLPLAAAEGRPKEAGVAVRMVSLAEALGGQAPHLVKCIAEGAEFVVFPQMFALGIRPEAVIVCASPHAGAAEDLVALFTANGYLVADADDPPKHARFHCRLRQPPSPSSA
jgi:FkbM family methyltransferase